MLNTLKEINNKIKYFCDINYNINEFVDGALNEFKPKDHLYPLVYVVPTGMRVSNGVVKFTINLTLMDLYYDNEDFVKKLSDLSITLSELNTYFDDDNEDFQYFVSLLNETTFNSFNNAMDKTIGWSGDIQFTLHYNMNMNRINAKVDVIPDGSQSIYYGTSPLTSLTDVEIKDLSSDVQGLARNRTISIHGNGEYIYYCYPVSFGLATFMVNGFFVTFENSIVDIDGVNYYVYKSQYIQYGFNIHIIIS